MDSPVEAESYSYTGKNIDKSTQFVYFGARYYDPEVGRFITEDPAKDGMNWFVYCRNNPLKYMDPDGKEPRLLKSMTEFSTSSGEGYTETIMMYSFTRLNPDGTIIIIDKTTHTIHFSYDIKGQKAAHDFRVKQNFEFKQAVGNTSLVSGH